MLVGFFKPAELEPAIMSKNNAMDLTYWNVDRLLL
jgi:hypothetical protein